MIHLLFLLLSLFLALLAQKIGMLVLNRLQDRTLRRFVQLLGLLLPLLALFFFSLTMLPSFENSPKSLLFNPEGQSQFSFAPVGVGLILMPTLLSFLYSLTRLFLLYRRTFYWTWEAPQGLKDLFVESTFSVQLRLWYSSRSFAFNLPALRPLASPVIVLSTRMVAQLNSEEQLPGLLPVVRQVN